MKDETRERWGVRHVGAGMGDDWDRMSSLEICRSLRTGANKYNGSSGKTCIIELIPVGRAFLVGDSASVSFVAKVTSLVFKVVFDFLVEG